MPRTDIEYADMADEFAKEPIIPAGPVTVYPERLNRGRPAGRKEAAGATPSTSVRLPVDIKERLEARAAAEGARPAEVIRRALVEYLDRHPA